MSFFIDDCVFVLVGIVQVLQQVCCIVEIGYFEVVVVCMVVDSVFCIDVDSFQEIYGSVVNVVFGLCLLYNYLCSQGQDEMLF